MIIIVSLLLSITSGVLKPLQDKNLAQDTKKQILSSLPSINVEDVDITELFDQTIKEYQILDQEGNVTKTLSAEEGFKYTPQEGEFPIIVAKVASGEKYIINVTGKGLWDAIWGYVSLNADRNTVNGTYFSHAGETPGLGARIKTKEFQDRFIGKHILNEGKFTSIAVLKTGRQDRTRDHVDALSGATITSTGVQDMLQSCLQKYATFFQSGQKVETQNQSIQQNSSPMNDPSDQTKDTENKEDK